PIRNGWECRCSDSS
ncbi:matrix protein 2, partial [Influenza A virus (A/northern pintail/California/44221-608/2006(H1N2))]